MEVKALRDCFVAGDYRRAGEKFEYSGPKNTNLQPQGGAKWPSSPDPKPAKPAAGEGDADKPGSDK